MSLKYSNLNYLARTKRTGDSIVTHTYQKLRLGFCWLCEVGRIRPNLGLSPLRVTVTTRIIPVLVGDPNPNLQFVTGILGRGTTQRTSGCTLAMKSREVVDDHRWIGRLKQGRKPVSHTPAKFNIETLKNGSWKTIQPPIGKNMGDGISGQKMAKMQQFAPGEV